jgi:hypothetical protein
MAGAWQAACSPIQPPTCKSACSCFSAMLRRLSAACILELCSAADGPNEEEEAGRLAASDSLRPTAHCTTPLATAPARCTASTSPLPSPPSPCRVPRVAPDRRRQVMPVVYMSFYVCCLLFEGGPCG